MDAAGKQERAAEQERRALEAISAIAAGANPTWEAVKLSNEFTDRQAGRFAAWLKRRKA